MTVFISSYAGGGGIIRNLYKVLERKGIRWTDAHHSSEDGLGLDYGRTKESLENCDAYITFMNSDLPTSLSADVELDYAVYNKIPVIALKFSRSDTGMGGNPLATKYYLQEEHVTIYDISAGASLKNLPKFLNDFVEKCRNSKENSAFVSENQKPDKPYEGDEPHIFISYSHKDMPKVFEVIRELQNHGFRVWYDEGIDPASEWDENIAGHINKCRYFIAFLSTNYVASQNCRDEVSYARDLGKERLLIYLEDTKLPAGMAMRLMRLQAIHKYKYKTSTEFYDKLFSAKGIDVTGSRK